MGKVSFSFFQHGCKTSGKCKCIAAASFAAMMPAEHGIPMKYWNPRLHLQRARTDSTYF